jgi:hypothetical protein
VGFEVCDKIDGRTPDPAYDKIVLYADQACAGAHAAKLLASGAWSSKLGDWEDIQHDTPEALQGHDYGEPLVYMKRPRAT